jgi:thiol-disulfide isomerase/thioredoxin
MKISKSFKTYIHIILVFLLSQSLYGQKIFQKISVIHEKPTQIKELKFKDSDLNDVDLTNKKGNIMILNFWATWCAPCKREMPSLEKLTNQFPHRSKFMLLIWNNQKTKSQRLFSEVLL